MNVRIRGIYATALTDLFVAAGADVVDASPSIRDRFGTAESEGSVNGPDVVDLRIETTDDRLGVSLWGSAATVDEARSRLADVGIDTLSWSDRTPRGALFDGTVTETLGGGAVMRLRVDGEGDPVEGYLPYDRADRRIETGDVLRVQVRETAPPWGSRRPELDTEIRVPGTLASLVPGDGTRVDARDEAAGRELAGMADLLGLEPPDGWGIRWHAPAVDAGMDALEAALSRGVDRLEPIESVLDAPIDPPQSLVEPAAGAWVWFGRDSRGALDDRRRSVTTTIPSHHRIKAGSASASAGVDLAEALYGSTVSEPTKEAAFPFDVVTDQFGPAIGESVRIAHGKPAGHLIVLGEGTVTDLDPEDGTITVERRMTGGGTYDALEVPRERGDVAVTTFKEDRWWYPTTYRDGDGAVKGTYVNVCTPVEIFPETVRYLDLHVDVIKHADGTVERVDDGVLDAAVADETVPEPLADRARSIATALENAL